MIIQLASFNLSVISIREQVKSNDKIIDHNLTTFIICRYGMPNVLDFISPFYTICPVLSLLLPQSKVAGWQFELP